MNLKDGVDARGVQPELVLGLVVAELVYRAHLVPFTVTALLDGKHMTGSLHYRGLAADLRLPSHYPVGVTFDTTIHAEIRDALGAQWDVLLESDHIHIEFDPKRPQQTTT